MVPLPIVDRELRVASRKRSTYLLRIVSAVFAGLMCGGFVFSNELQWNQSGQPLFRSVVWIAFWAALATGMFTTADCLSSEKRQGTLGLLFLTNLRAHQVVLGKLAATSLNAIYALVAVLPMLALPILMGGVTASDVLQAAGVLGLTLFLSLCFGMLVSALSSTEFEAMLGTLLALMALCVVPGLLAALWNGLTGQLMVGQVIGLLNPYHLLLVSFRAVSAPSGTVLLLPFVLGGCVGLSCLFLASWLVRRFSRDASHDSFRLVQKTRNIFKNVFRSRTPAPPARLSVSEKLRAYRRPLLDMNPMLWLVNREPLRIKYVWFILGVFACIWIVGFFSARRVWLDWAISVFFVVFLNGSLKLLLAAEAPRQLNEDRKSGALELILSTPLTEQAVLRGYCQALWRQFGGPMIVVVVAEVLLIWAGSIHRPGQDLGQAMFIIVAAVLLVVDAVALTMMGVWASLTAQSAARAAIRGIIWLLLVPWAIYFLTIFWLELHKQSFLWHLLSKQSNIGSWSRTVLNYEVIWLIWLSAILIYDFFWIRRAHAKIKGSLRKLAAESYGST
ncbi:MAG: ABC transporter permease [Verrucomicrobiota bacterium]